MNSGSQSRDQKQPLNLATFVRDLISVASLGILLLFIHTKATPFLRGFHCNDETIRYPYKESTISSGLCYLGGSGINILLILFLEYQQLVYEAQNSREAASEFQLRVYIRNVYYRLLIWFLGAISSELLTDISKVTAGRLRPHFISICQPLIRNESALLELDEYCQIPGNQYKYIMDYKCMGNESRQRDTRLSFMSGHSSYSAYSAAFAVFYLQSMMDIAKFGLVKPAFQVLIASTAFYTGLTRVSDYKHHWQDVLAGLLQGTTVAAFVSLNLWPPFYKTCTKYLKNPGARVGDDQVVGEELNSVSY